MSIVTSSTSGITTAQRTVIANAQFTAEHTPVCANLYTKFKLNKGEKTIVVPKWGQVSASAITEGTDLQNPTSLTMTTTSITTTEVGLLVVLTDKMVRQYNEDAMSQVGRLMGEAMGRKIDLDGLAMFSGFNTTMGSAGTTITWGHLTASIAKLWKVPVNGQLVGVLHPYHLHRLMNALAPVGTYPIPNGLSEALVKNFLAGWDKMAGIPMFRDGNITTDSSDDSYSAVFSKDVVAYTVQKEWAVETERDASLRGTELVAVADYSFTEINGTYGCYLLFDATAPTA